MQYTNFIWRNSEPYSEMFDDIYYSSNQTERISGENEFKHVFFKHNGLPQRWNKRHSFVIAELGFGSGLNCLLTIREWLKHCTKSGQHKTLHYIAIEKYPLSIESITQLLARYPELDSLRDELLDSYPPAVGTTHCRHLFDHRVVIHYHFMDACEALDGGGMKVDAWYLDGFSPAKNNAMWSQPLFLKIAENSVPQTTCSTYTAAGFVKRNLKNAGFSVSKVKGFGRKREMLCAEFTAEFLEEEPSVYTFADKPWFVAPKKITCTDKKAVVIGAGIAGMCAAHALIKRGWTVTVIEKHAGIANEATSNPLAIVYPRLSANNDIDSEFFTAAYCYNLSCLSRLQEKHRQPFWFASGLLQSMDKSRALAILQKFQFNEDYMRIVDTLDNETGLSPSTGPSTGQAKEKVLVEYKSAGMVIPGALCNAIKQQCGNALTVIHAEINGINKKNGVWQSCSDKGVIAESSVLIIANGTDINAFNTGPELPVESVRGQVAILASNSKLKRINKVINAGFYITPSVEERHYLGATYSRGSLLNEAVDADNDELLTLLNANGCGVFSQHDIQDAWVGFRTMAKDRVPIVGAVADEHFFKQEYADIRHGKTSKPYKAAKYHSGLYISAAHGSRGFTSSFLSAEIIAAQICGEPTPVSKRVLDYLSPSRFIVNDLKRR